MDKGPQFINLTVPEDSVPKGHCWGQAGAGRG